MLYFEYQLVYYKNYRETPVLDYLSALPDRERAKIKSYIDLLIQNKGRLLAPYAKHIYKKIWELRIKYDKKQHRIFYFVSSQRKIVLLSAFIKKTNKTPHSEIKKAYSYYIDYINP